MKPLSLITVLLILFVVLNTNIISEQKEESDIKAVYVKHSPEKITLQNPVVFIYRIENCGKKEIPAKSYDVEFYVDNKLINFDYTTPKLKVKGYTIYSTEKESRYIPRVIGKHIYKLIIVPKNRLKELNKKNNIIEGSFIVEK